MLFGIFRCKEGNYIERIQVSNDIDEYLNEVFRSQCEDFFANGKEKYEIKEFYPGDPNSDEVISRIDFDDVDGLQKAIASPTTTPICDLDEDLRNLVAIFMKHPKNEGQVLIQLVENRRLLLPKSGWLIFKKLQEKGVVAGADMLLSPNAKGTLVDADNCGIKLDNKITAVFDSGTLFFKSYFQINKIFDLSDYLVEATDDTVKEFLALDCIDGGENVAEVLESLTKLQRKRIAKVMVLGFVKKYSATEIASRAKGAKLNIRIEVENGKIKLPSSSRDRTTLLQFLANGIMKSYLDDDNDYEVGSMRPHK